MQALIQFLTRVGEAALGWLAAWGRILTFGAHALIEAATPSAYNSAMRSVVMKQIYFTAWQILPGFLVFAALLSYVIIQIVVATARDFGLSEFALEMSIRVLVLELLPLLTALFVALRSGAAINTEVALMHINNELAALQASGVDPMRFEFTPRVIGGAVSVYSLTLLSCVLASVLAYVAVYGLQPWALGEFRHVIAKIFTPVALIALTLKSLAFGLAVTVIPMRAGLEAPRMLFFAPIAVLRGMVRLFFVLMLIEVASLSLVYL
ncbi:MAG: ABC transporter permease [Thiobacillaceae bacterium]|nr:ABC transporter permease [Thiobacillaceae bacterium]MCX7672569.1 ABC transporter permease [Thiobacillaceae bacterium]MDW8322509.1 ABC transporter permease [Burkholderiales bacterium]